MRKEEYIQEVISRIENKKARREVEKELSAHIDDRISYYTDAGWDEQTANEKAMEHMGKSEEVAEEMGKLHRKGFSKAILIITCIGVAKLLLARFFYYPHNEIINSLRVGFMIVEVLTEAWNYYFIQAFIVLLFLTIKCEKRHKEGELSVIDLILTVVCVAVWIIAAIASNKTVLLFF